MTSASGKCLCGGVTFEATLPSKWVAHCHCSMCRRAHGAAFVTWVGFEESRLAISDGQDLLRWYNSSAAGRRAFCTRCGSTLFFASERWPGEVHVARANFDDPVDRAPQTHVFYDTRVDWFEVHDELPKKPPA